MFCANSILLASSGYEVAHICIGLGPIALYLLLLGAINLSKRPLLVTGLRDSAALGVAVCGLVMIGPAELLLPPAMIAELGPMCWLLVLGLYLSGLTLLVLLLPPRLVIYNVSLEELQGVLAGVGQRLDSQAHWSGNTLVIPNRNMQFALHSFAVLRNVSLVAAGEQQNYQSWRDLEIMLRDALTDVQVKTNPRGLTMVGMALLILVGLAIRWISDPQAVTQGFIDMLGI